MLGRKYLSEAVHIDEIESGVLNLVKAPVGAGKTYWALSVLAQEVDNRNEMLYLIDTNNGKTQIAKNEGVEAYQTAYLNLLEEGISFWEEQNIVLMTYAKFGSMVSENKDYGSNFKIIVCDEIQNVIRFSYFGQKQEDKPFHEIAKKRLEEITQNQLETKVIGLSATPERAEKEFYAPYQYITVDEEVRAYEVKETRYYSNLEYLIETIPEGKTGLIYVAHVRKMKQLVQIAEQRGLRAVAIWSIRNTKDPMTEEQDSARNYILDKEELPPAYDIVIINASSETSINIRGQVDYIVIHTTEAEVRTQVRGRFRNDLDLLYLFDSGSLEVPEEYMEKPLFKSDRERLCAILQAKDKYGRKVAWTTTKKKLEEEGYIISEGRSVNRRYSVISM